MSTRGNLLRLPVAFVEASRRHRSSQAGGMHTVSTHAIRRTVIFGIPATALAGCYPAPPKYEDALSGLHNLPGSNAPSDAPFKAGPTIALVFGSNIERILQHRSDADAATKSMGPLFTSTEQLADQDPQYVITAATGILRRRYPQLEGIDDIATAAQRKFSSTIVLDVTVRLGTYSGKQTLVALTAIAFGSRQQPESRLEASGAATLGYPAWTTKQKEASDVAIAVFKAKVDRYWS